MKKLQWNMEEVFYFPESVGVPKDARLLKVKAGFTEKRSDDAVRLSGIYHIVAKVGFEEGQRSAGIPTDAIFVDDVEIEGETGYFEYAVPLYIDLPPEVEHPLHIEATNVKSNFDGQGSFMVTWNVNCTYGQNSTTDAASEVENSAAANSPAAEQETKSQAAGNPETYEEKAELAQELPKEKVAAGKQEQTQTAQVNQSQRHSAAQKKTAAAPVEESQTAAMHDSSLGNSHDDILSYIAALPDERTTSRFRSNDIFVKEES